MFPRGQTLHYRQKSTEWLSKAEQARTKLAAQEILRDVRQTFLELYYHSQASHIIERSREAGFVDFVGKFDREGLLESLKDYSREMGVAA